MNSYLRMLRMIRPYLPQAAVALVFMLLFSFFSVFSFTMISPFLNFFLASGKKLPGSASNLTAGFALEYSRLFKLKR